MNGVRKLACGIVCLAAFAASSAFAAGSLPSGYTEVEYIESDGNQYIDTLWTNGSDHVVTLDIQPTELPTSSNTSGLGGVRPCYGCRTAYNVKNISFFMDYANSAPAVTVDFNNSNHTPYRLSAGSISADRRYVVVDSAATRSVTGYDSSSNVVTTASDTDNCSDDTDNCFDSSTDNCSDNYSDDTDKWHTSLEGTCSIEGSTVTMTFLPEDGVTTTCILNVQSITSTEMVASAKRTTIDNGRTVHELEAKIRMVKVGADYSADIIGMWEGHSTGEEGSEFDDGENHRWEYMTDGSFNYFHKVDGQWQISDDDYANYFVDGNLLCTRWIDNEIEYREWWEIESIEN